MNIGDTSRAEDFNSGAFDPPVFQTLGGAIEFASEGHSRVRFPFRAEWTIPGGFVQGGFQAAMIDEGMIVAVRTLLAAGEQFTTAQLEVNYLRPAAGESFLCESEVMRRGRGVIYVESSLSSNDGRLLARASSTLVRVTAETRTTEERPPA